MSLSFEQLNISYGLLLKSMENIDHNISAEIEGESEENDDDIFGSVFPKQNHQHQKHQLI